MTKLGTQQFTHKLATINKITYICHMNNKYKGVVIEIGPENRFSDKFVSKQIVLEDKSSKYPKNAAFEFVNAAIEKIDGLRIGDEIDVTFEPTSRKSKDGRWFTSNRAWEIGIMTSHSPNKMEFKSNPQPSAPVSKPKVEDTPYEDTELPF